MKKIHCENVYCDYIQVETGEYDGVKKCSIDVHSDVDRIILDAKKIRKLRKQLKRALVEIEGDKDEGDDWFSVGKKVKIVDRLSGHGFQIGQIVKYVGTTPMGNEKLESLDGSNWYAVHKDDCAPA